MTKKHVKNEYDPRLIGIDAINPLPGSTSASRMVMFSNHMSQRPTISKPNKRRVTSGLDLYLSEGTYSIKFPCDCTIISIVERYPRGIDIHSIKFNPETIIIYQNLDNNEIGYLSVPYYRSNHTYFGFKYKLNNNYKRIYEGARIEKGTIIADSPQVTDDGFYRYGIELNTCFMSHPAGSEDGILVCEDILERMGISVFETRVVEFGSESFPLNIYSDNPDIYKPFPEIGDYIHSSGILMALRDFNINFNPGDFSIYDIMEIDHIFDRCTYVRGPGDNVIGSGKIIDIKLYYDGEILDSPYTHLFIKYSENLKNFYNRLLDIENRLRKEHKKLYGENNLRITPQLQTLLVMANAMKQDAIPGQKLIKHYKNSQLDTYRIEFTIEYNVIPDMGFKLTGTSGNRQL